MSGCKRLCDFRNEWFANEVEKKRVSGSGQSGPCVSSIALPKAPAAGVRSQEQRSPRVRGLPLPKEISAKAISLDLA